MTVFFVCYSLLVFWYFLYVTLDIALDSWPVFFHSTAGKGIFICYSWLVTRYFLYVTLDMPLTPLHLTGDSILCMLLSTCDQVFFVCYTWHQTVVLPSNRESAPLSQVTALCVQMACAKPITFPNCPPPVVSSAAQPPPAVHPPSRCVFHRLIASRCWGHHVRLNWIKHGGWECHSQSHASPDVQRMVRICQ